MRKLGSVAVDEFGASRRPLETDRTAAWRTGGRKGARPTQTRLSLARHNLPTWHNDGYSPRRAGIALEVPSPFAFHSNPTVQTQDIKLKGDNLAFQRNWCQKIPSVRTLPGTRLRTFHKADCSSLYGAPSRALREVRQRQLALESTSEGSTVALRYPQRSTGASVISRRPRS